MLSLTFLGSTAYIVYITVGFGFSGIGIGLFATPALDTAMSTTPKNKVGVASAIFKNGIDARRGIRYCDYRRSFTRHCRTQFQSQQRERGVYR